MEIEELRSRIINHIEKKTSQEFPITDEFLLACLDNSIMVLNEVRVNRVSIWDNYTNRNNDHGLTIKVLELWIERVESCLKPQTLNLNRVVRGVRVPHQDTHQELLYQSSQLYSQCVSE